MPIKIKTLCELICEQFGDRTIQILIIACIASLGVGIWKDVDSEVFFIFLQFLKVMEYEFLEGLSILVTISLCVVIGSWNNYAKEKQFQKLMQSREERNITVLRNGEIMSISVHALLVGDLLVFSEGEQVPADCILLSGTKVSADESSQTGESRDIDKHPLDKASGGNANPFLLSGTMIKEGKGTAIVICVGENTRMGRLKKLMEEEEELTPLQRKLERIANGIGKMGLIVAILTVVAMLIWLLVHCFQEKAKGGPNPFTQIETLRKLLNVIVFGITIVVMAVPEGLPLAVTLSLAYAVGKMKDENNLVRQLDSCETMGGSNNICSDKTGTLTKNQMTVMGIFVENEIYDNRANVPNAVMTPETKELLCYGICVNSQAYILIDPQSHEKKRIGNATECALLSMAESMGYNYEKYRVKEMEVLTIPFNSKRKRMTSVYKTNDASKLRVYVKGAPDLLLPICNRIIAQQGKIVEMDQSTRDSLKARVLHHNAECGYRSILVAYKEISADRFDPNLYQSEAQYEELEADLTLIGIIGIEDPLRDGVDTAVAICQRAGITVRMVTGDDIEYAVSIALKCGILTREEIDPKSRDYKEYAVMMGIDLWKKTGGLVKEPGKEKGEEKDRIANPEIFGMIAKDLKVLARSQPEHKYLLVTGLKEDEKNVIAVTGDGTNDAPALKKADIGFAMGIAGTEMAKEAGKIILLDDNFSSIVTALKWGRNIYLSIRRFLQFQLTVNIVALVISVVSGVAGKENPPINALQMLWVNLIMDTFAALALATEPPSDKLLLERPYPKTESILNRPMLRNIVCIAIYQIAFLLVLIFAEPWFFFHYDETVVIIKRTNEKLWTAEVVTMTFHAFVLMQLTSEICARRFKSSEWNMFENIFVNCKFVFIWIITVGVQFILVCFENKGVRTIPLSGWEHLICIAFALGVLPWAYITKRIISEDIFSFISIDETVSILYNNIIKKAMTDQEMAQGYLKSFLRKQRNIKPKNPENIYKQGMKSFSYPKRSIALKVHGGNLGVPMSKNMIFSVVSKK